MHTTPDRTDVDKARTLRALGKRVWMAAPGNPSRTICWGPRASCSTRCARGADVIRASGVEVFRDQRRGAELAEVHRAGSPSTPPTGCACASGRNLILAELSAALPGVALSFTSRLRRGARAHLGRVARATVASDTTGRSTTRGQGPRRDPMARTLAGGSTPPARSGAASRAGASCAPSSCPAAPAGNPTSGAGGTPSAPRAGARPGASRGPVGLPPRRGTPTAPRPARDAGDPVTGRARARHRRAVARARDLEADGIVGARHYCGPWGSRDPPTTRARGHPSSGSSLRGSSGAGASSRRTRSRPATWCARTWTPRAGAGGVATPPRGDHVAAAIDARTSPEGGAFVFWRDASIPAPSRRTPRGPRGGAEIPRSIPRARRRGALRGVLRRALPRARPIASAQTTGRHPPRRRPRHAPPSRGRAARRGPQGGLCAGGGPRGSRRTSAPGRVVRPRVPRR